MNNRLYWPLLCLVLVTQSSVAALTDARDIVRAAMDHWRGVTSHSTMQMTIHRPEWQRTMTMRGWTRGEKHSLVRILEPKKDAGNGTLLIDNQMWTYSPKINRIIKVPSSMMNQSWMGSDLSNKDISKSTDVIEQYTHSLISTEQQDDRTLYTVASVPHEDAAVVWGKEVFIIRDDFVLIEHQFWDQDGELVKIINTEEITQMGGRAVASRMRISKLAEPDKWTEMRTLAVEFDLDIPDSLFTQSNLRNPRQ